MAYVGGGWEWDLRSRTTVLKSNTTIVSKEAAFIEEERMDTAQTHEYLRINGILCFLKTFLSETQLHVCAHKRNCGGKDHAYFFLEDQCSRRRHPTYCEFPRSRSSRRVQFCRKHKHLIPKSIGIV